ncbi:hypothetical protein AB0I28_12620 [Phytomonospora sp. NPDC050363]|uniref:hypothetical protein n=1 Tax=Phytomonospora sp. NPDC050363 TaxID=3155642 RepID=UPI003402450F
MADDPHAEAAIALLKAHPDLVVFDDEVPASPPSAYVRVYIGMRELEPDDPNFIPGEQSCWIYTYCVANTDAGARLIRSFVRAQLNGVKPVVAGKTCWPIYWEDGSPAGRDESLGYPVISQRDVWCFKSDD